MRSSGRIAALRIREAELRQREEEEALEKYKEKMKRKSDKKSKKRKNEDDDESSEFEAGEEAEGEASGNKITVTDGDCYEIINSEVLNRRSSRGLLKSLKSSITQIWIF